MIKNLWRNFEGWLDPYYELSPEEAERLVVVKSQYLNALWSLERARDDLNNEIFYLQLKIDRIDRALQSYPDSFYLDDLETE